MDARDLTLLLAGGAGVISFISPCVLPLVPAYLGQLANVAAVGADPGTGRARGLVLAAAAAYVLGFGAVFTLFGVTATYLLGPLGAALPGLRQAGGVLLVVMGLGLAGILPIPLLARSWRPLDVAAARALAGAGGPGTAVRSAIGGPTGPTGRGLARGLVTSFAIGGVFAVGWTPCVGPILGAILTVAASQGTVLQGGLLLVAYSLGLGIPFLALALVFERAPAIVRPITRHGRAVSLAGGLLVAAMGVAIFFDVLVTFNRYFFFGV